MHNKIRGKVVGNPATTPMRVPDFEQNDPRKSDYINNRPFYKERKYYADVELSNSEIDEERGAYFIPIEGLASIDVTPFELIVEVDDNGTSHKATAYFDGCSLMDKFANPITLDGYEFWDYTDNKLYFASPHENFDGVTLRIYKETTKKIEKEYLPKCDVPYIYSDVEEGVIFGRVALFDLDSGAYVLHGVFDTAPDYFNLIYHFANKPTLCHIINDHQGTVKLYWLDEDTDTEDGVCVRSMLIVDYDIVSDMTIPLSGNSGAEEALELASQANDTANAALENAMDAVDGLQVMQEEVDSALASAEEALAAVGVLGDPFEPRDFIVLRGADDRPYMIKLDSDNKLVVTQI